MPQSSISIAMATFNGARYLGEQLASLSAQSAKPLELVICDDASADETLEILKSFAAAAPFTVKIIQNAERLGYQRNFIKAASKCQGALISFCDQDDIWNLDKLAVVNNHFAHTEALLLAHDYAVFFDDGRPEIPSFSRHLALSGFSQVVNIKGCSLTLSQKLIELVGWPPQNSSWSHDTWVCFSSLLLEKHGYIKEPLIRHRIHGNNTSGKIPAGKGRLFRFLRRLRLPPFTSSTDLDAFIAVSVGPKDLDLFRAGLKQCEPAMTSTQCLRAPGARKAPGDLRLYPQQCLFASRRENYRRGWFVFWASLSR